MMNDFINKMGEYWSQLSFDKLGDILTYKELELIGISKKQIWSLDKANITFILAMAIAMLLNMTTVASLSELNALMPNTTGGLAQYTLAALGPFPTLISMVGGYIICNTMSCGVEASIFSFSLADVVGGHIPSFASSTYAMAPSSFTAANG